MPTVHSVLTVCTCVCCLPCLVTGRGAELLVADRVKPILSSALERALTYLVALDENKLNGKVRQASRNVGFIAL